MDRRIIELFLSFLISFLCAIIKANTYYLPFLLCFFPSLLSDLSGAICHISSKHEFLITAIRIYLSHAPIFFI